MNNDDKKRYSKQILMPEIGEDGQEKLLNSSVMIAGCGALGSVIANSVVRCGVGRVKIVDRDFIETDNLPRQVLFDEEDIKNSLPKAIAATRKLKLINSKTIIEPIVGDITSENIEDLIKDVDIVLDGTDNFETRFLINNACVKHNVPWVYGGVVSTHGMSAMIIPGDTPCLQCYISEIPAPGTTPTCDTVGVLGTVVNIVASIEVTEAIKLLAGKKESLLYKLAYLDPWNGQMNFYDIRQMKRHCVVCDDREFAFLEKKAGSQAVSLCGQNAVQISASAGRPVPLSELAARLSQAGEVTYNEYMLRLKVDNYAITVFPEGRVIIKGTHDIAQAKTIYSKYIGT